MSGWPPSAEKLAEPDWVAGWVIGSSERVDGASAWRRNGGRAAAGSLLESDAVLVVPLAHVGDDHLFADVEPLHDLDRVHGAAPELHVHPARGGVVGVELEEADRALGLAVGRAADVEDVLEPL